MKNDFSSAAEATSPWSTLALQLEALRTDIREDIASTRKDLGDALHRVEANVSLALDGYREQGTELAQHMARCEQRHRRDTDEARRFWANESSIAACATRIAVLEETGVARGNWRRQVLAVTSAAIAAVAAGCAIAQAIF